MAQRPSPAADADVAGGASPVPAYPAWWEADVVLYDGTTLHLRPIRGDDADALQAFHTAQSEQSQYFRFFAPMARLPAATLELLTHVDHVDRVALVAVTDAGEQERIVGVGRYDRTGPDAAEVAFFVADAIAGLGLGSVLLEHLAAAARERGIRRFVADVLPANARMIAVFRDAGFEVRQRTEDGVVAVSFGIDPTDRSLAVLAAREHRAESVSVRGLLTWRSVVVVGPGDRPGPRRDLHVAMAERVLPGLVAARPDVHVYAVGLDTTLRGVHRFVDLSQVPGPVDLAVVAVDPRDAVEVVSDLAQLSVRGVVLLSAGFAEDGPVGLDRQRALLRTAHAAGMRVVGPSTYGLIAHDGPLLRDASLATELPPAGPVGLFCQSAPLAVMLLSSLRRRGLGLSSFLSAGHRADVSGNDLMQFWTDDEATGVVALYLESIGNPRKFSRVARRLSAVKPVVVVTAGQSGQVVPPGHAVRPTRAPHGTLCQVLRQSGVLQVHTTHQLMDAVQLFASQPLPAGPRTAILASSASVAALAAEAAATAGLQVSGEVGLLAEDASTAELQAVVDAAYADPGSDAVLVVRVRMLAGDDDLTGHLARAAARTGRTTVACLPDLVGVTAALTAPDADDVPRTVPAYASPEDAAAALGLAARYAAYRAGDHGRPVRPAGVDTAAARRLVEQWLAAADDADAVLPLDDVRTVELLGCVGIAVHPAARVVDAPAAVAAADGLGWPVALTSTVPALRRRTDLGGVRLDLDDPAELTSAVGEMAALNARFGAAGAPMVVQSMAPRGVSCVLRSAEDPLFGPLVSFGLAGDATELLGDVAARVAPLTDVDVRELVRSVRGAPKLLGTLGAPAVDLTALEDLVARLAVLADDLPEVRSTELDPVVAAEQGVAVLAARVALARTVRADAVRRALPTV